MSIASGVVRGRAVARSGTVLMARIVGYNNVAITRATLTQIDFLVRDLTAQTSGSQRTLTIADVIFDTLQTTALDPSWTEDSTGYNFRYIMPASDLAWTAGVDFQGNPAPHTFQADVKFTPATGEPFIVPFIFPAVPRFVA